jgi:hypothetical protein
MQSLSFEFTTVLKPESHLSFVVPCYFRVTCIQLFVGILSVELLGVI